MTACACIAQWQHFWNLGGQGDVCLRTFSAAYYGPEGSSISNANTSGLAALGNPAYEHRYYVDATPQVFDVDFAKTYASRFEQPAWTTMVVGGLGKGGRGFYALNMPTLSNEH